MSEPEKLTVDPDDHTFTREEIRKARAGIQTPRTIRHAVRPGGRPRVKK